MTGQNSDVVAQENWELIVQSLDRLSEGITIIDGQDRLVLYNMEAAKYLGIDPAQIGVGVSLHEIAEAQSKDVGLIATENGLFPNEP